MVFVVGFLAVPCFDVTESLRLVSDDDNDCHCLQLSVSIALSYC